MRTDPDKAALVVAETGETVTFAELEDRSSRLASVLRGFGLHPGDHVALLMENQARFSEVVWAALRSGLYLTPINWHLKPDEARYILEDCGARVLITTTAAAPLAATLLAARPQTIAIMADGAPEGFLGYEAQLAAAVPDHSDSPLGAWMLYSSGTTGRPKGILRPLTGTRASVGNERVRRVLAAFNFDADSVFFSPGPAYHAAPLQFCYGVQLLGGTVVIARRFDPMSSLRTLECHGITHSQWVPTMFVRLLALPEEERRAHDLPHHKVALHSGAPCPVEVKRAMMAWWGSILHEYYGASEGCGLTAIGPDEWLHHPGSVGRPLGTTRVHIVDEGGHLLPPGEVGTVYFDGEAGFAYHNDPERTVSARHSLGWATVGDIGHLDADGYLYLTDRQGMTIISGGVNIYPQEVENALAAHSAVMDVAVVGLPDPEWGESVRAIVQPFTAVQDGPLEADLRRHCQERLATFKCPRSYLFVTDLPRMESGKLDRREVKRRYVTEFRDTSTLKDHP